MQAWKSSLEFSDGVPRRIEEGGASRRCRGEGLGGGGGGHCQAHVGLLVAIIRRVVAALLRVVHLLQPAHRHTTFTLAPHVRHPIP